jgi:branched-chain amino acid transport system substrate-binding protein
MNDRLRRRRWTAGGLMGLCLAAVIGMAAVGSASSLASDAHSSAAGFTSRDLAVAHAYVGGKEGKATLSPIEVGYINNNTGPTAQPYLETATQNALNLVNNYLGGIAGHPIKLVSCSFGGTAEQGQECGTEFANNPKIKLVFFPGGTTGGPQLHAAIAGAKVTLCTVASPPDVDVQNGFCTEGGALATGAIASYLKDFVDAKTVSILSIDDPTLESILQGEQQQYAGLGITATIGFTDPAATDVEAPLVAANVQTTDATLLEIPLDSPCPAYAKALALLNVKTVISLSTCRAADVEQALGYIPPWTYFDYGQIAQLPDPTGQMGVFLDAQKAYHDNASGQNATQTFGTALLMAKIMNEAGFKHLTTAAMSAKLKAFTGPAFLGDPVLKFGAQPFPSVGSTRARFFTYLGNGKWKDATGGKWVSAPPAAG